MLYTSLPVQTTATYIRFARTLNHRHFAEVHNLRTRQQPVYSYIRLLPDNHPPQPLQHNILQQLYTAPPSPLVTLQPHRIQINHQFLHAATVTITTITTITTLPNFKLSSSSSTPRLSPLPPLPPLPPCLISSCHPVPPRRDCHHSTITTITTLPNFKLSSSSSTPRLSPFHITTITTLPNFKLSSSSSTPRLSPFHHYHHYHPA